MEYSIVEAMSNPIRMKIVQEIIKKETATTKEIAQACSEIPQATLYRAINKLVKNNIIEVVSENKIRGVSEKVYKIKVNPFDVVDQIVEENNKDGLVNLFYNFMMTLMADFQNYASNEEVNFIKDVIGIRSYAAYLTDEESMELMKEIRESIAKRINNEKTPERRLRKLSTVFVPVDDK